MKLALLALSIVAVLQAGANAVAVVRCRPSHWRRHRELDDGPDKIVIRSRTHRCGFHHPRRASRSRLYLLRGYRPAASDVSRVVDA
jgi:hypothetical protein